MKRQLFHITPSKNYQSIMQRGLLLSKHVKRAGRSSAPRIFLGEAFNFRERLIHLAALHRCQKFSVLSVTIPAEFAYRCFGFWVCERNIPSLFIEHVCDYSAKVASYKSENEVTLDVTMAHYNG